VLLHERDARACIGYWGSCVSSGLGAGPPWTRGGLSRCGGHEDEQTDTEES
jgi:hypothetical protein